METLKLKHYKILMLLGIWLSTVPVFSQVETYEDCFSKKSNADLKNLNKKQKGEAVDGRFYTSNARIKAEGMVWQTSFFRDRPPKFVVSKTKPKNQTHNEWAEDTCLFNAYNVQDQQAGTYWCEGASGPGIGEVVSGLIDLEKKNYFYILPGANGLRKNFESYSRPSEIVVHYLLPGKVDTSQAGGSIFLDVSYFGKQSVKLSSEPGYQKIEVQPYKEILKEMKGKEDLLVLVAIEIKSVIEGKENKEHTCIAEIGNFKDEAFYKKPTLRD
ncbi:hypothetical protein FH582_21360 [Leptospira interrogans]|uniref:NADase-type glycan-binding domain-containing protein n=1 Tax=Leptospira interrogans TaxID=173 RepID=UPI001F0DF386|nr:hypothetical protein [Leptospira interrogans]UMQ53421.1 hypothetical protein FH582_15945 [Leptospira interrogans]UMQ53998.1 hypothetical protein FH582_19115 [Leptospira interrogans]UMQ54380.1 hypothetical protein FH582_21295 [Leptospira interrogans]UMQ54392.1 hypothetical protein FH582_21360 [Leptospira interrogans]